MEDDGIIGEGHPLAGEELTADEQHEYDRLLREHLQSEEIELPEIKPAPRLDP